MMEMIQEFLMANYLYIKAFHIIAVICWMAGLLYLPRIFVYHTGVEKGSEASEIFKTMEYKLLKYIMNPAFIATWVFAGLMIWAFPDIFKQAWFHAKFTLIVILSAFHHVLARWVKRFGADNNEKDHKFYRFMNEVPTIIMVVVVILVVAKPF